MITFKKVRDAFGWLGNMSPHPVTTQLWDMDPVVWPTAEHLFQAMRFQKWVLFPNDGKPLTPEQLVQAEAAKQRNAVVKEIKETKSPMGAKMIAKKHADKMVITPRTREDIDNMGFVLERKFKSNPELIPLLLATGDEELVEDVSNRPNESGLFWGKANVNGTWNGFNVLGLLLMERRGIIRRMPTYSIELTEEQLKALSQMCMMAEYWKCHRGAGCLDQVEGEVFLKVCDQMERYYADNGIED